MRSDLDRSSKWVQPLRVGILAFSATYAVHAYNGAPRQQVTLWLCIFVLAAYATFQATRVQTRSVRRAALALACLFAVWTVMGREITTFYGISKLGNRAELLDRLWMMVGFAALYDALLKLLLDAVAGERTWGIAAQSRRFGSGRGGFWLLWGVILLCWLPYFLSLYPGLLSEDSFSQIRQAAGLEALVDAHPIIHTALVALCWRIGTALGSQELSIGLYSAIQMGLLAACFAYALRAMARWRVHGALWWGALFFFALSPIQGIYSLLMWKDVLHAGFTLLLVVQLFELAMDPERMLGSRLRLAGLIATAVLFCIWRNNGLLAFMLFLPMLLCFVWRKSRVQWKRVLVMVGILAVCLTIYRGPVFQLAGVRNGPVREILSIPAQQIARTVRDHGSELSEADRAIIGEILPLDELAQLYQPRIADSVKNRLNDETFVRQPGRYIELWTRLLVQYPSTYLASFLCSNYGYWYPDTEQWVITLGEILQESDNVFGLKTRPIVPIFFDVQEQIDRQFRDVQGFRMLFSIGLMIWVEVLAAVILVVKRRRELLLPFGLLLFWWCTVLFCPLSAEYRYSYALVLCAPVCLGATLAARPGIRDAKP